MIWATVSSQSGCCWLYRVSPSLDTKNIINLILVLTLWWSLCVESSLVLLKEGAFYDQCSLGKTRLPFALLHSALWGQICLLLQDREERIEIYKCIFPCFMMKWNCKEINRSKSISGFCTYSPNLVKAMVFPVVMRGCQSWTVKKSEHQRTDAFEL